MKRQPSQRAQEGASAARTQQLPWGKSSQANRAAVWGPDASFWGAGSCSLKLGGSPLGHSGRCVWRAKHAGQAQERSKEGCNVAFCDELAVGRFDIRAERIQNWPSASQQHGTRGL